MASVRLITILGCMILELSSLGLCSTIIYQYTRTSILDQRALGKHILCGKKGLRHITPKELNLLVDVGIISHDGVQSLIYHEMCGPELVVNVRVRVLDLVQP